MEFIDVTWSKFKEEVAPEERVTIEKGETDIVELAEETGEDSDVPEGDKVSELAEKSTETSAEVVAGVEEGKPTDATGQDMESELKEHVVSEDAQQAA